VTTGRAASFLQAEQKVLNDIVFKFLSQLLSRLRTRILGLYFFVRVGVKVNFDVSLGFGALEYILKFQENPKFGSGFSMCTVFILSFFLHLGPLVSSVHN
jgi:hypothetical protein